MLSVFYCANTARLHGKMCLKFLLFVSFVVGSAALSEFEWKEAFVKICGKYTEYVNEENLKELDGLFTEDAELLWPAMSQPKRNRVESVEEAVFEEIPIEHRNVGFLELLHSAPDAAVAFNVGYVEMLDGTERTAKGIIFLVTEDDQVKIKLNILNYD